MAPELIFLPCDYRRLVISDAMLYCSSANHAFLNCVYEVGKKMCQKEAAVFLRRIAAILANARVYDATCKIKGATPERCSAADWHPTLIVTVGILIIPLTTSVFGSSWIDWLMSLNIRNQGLQFQNLRIIYYITTKFLRTFHLRYCHLILHAVYLSVNMTKYCRDKSRYKLKKHYVGKW